MSIWKFFRKLFNLLEEMYMQNIYIVPVAYNIH